MRLARHRHASEQATIVLDGAVIVEIDDETHRRTPGRIAHIPANAPHSARAMDEAALLEIFSPPRADFA